MRIAPRPGGGLTHAHLTHDTVHGRVEVRWRIEDGEMRVDVTIPENTTATVELPMHPDIEQLDIGGGSHTWVYQLVIPECPIHTLGTPLGTLAADSGVRQAIIEVFGQHLPGIPIDIDAPEAAGMPLGDVLTFIPGVSEELKNDLVNALTAARRGNG
jgi:alpha-L-rhamnosidase